MGEKIIIPGVPGPEDRSAEDISGILTITLYKDGYASLNYPKNFPLSLIMVSRALDILAQEMMRGMNKPDIVIPQIVPPKDPKKLG